MISVIVITYNRVKNLKYCIKSLLNQSCKHYEIVIIDDGSTRSTQQFIKKLQRKYNIIKYFRQENEGRGAARNLGLRKAIGNIIAFTDDDCILPQNWLESLENLFEEYPDVVAVGGSVVNEDESGFGKAAYILNFSSWLPIGEERYIKDIPTANIAYRKGCIKGRKFITEHSNLDYEDSLFNHGLIQEDKKILFSPSIKVYHNPRIDNNESFLNNQQRKAISFFLRGYKIHGFAGRLLTKFRFLNLFCPRLLLVFLKCLKSPEYFFMFLFYSPLIFRGELERGLAIVKFKKNHS